MAGKMQMAGRLRPPLSPAEVEQIAESVSRYAPDQIAVAIAEDHFGQMFGESELTDFAPFPLDCLPEPLRALASETATATGCDPAHAALPAIAASAAALGNTRRIALKDSWHEPAVIWCGIVGESGTSKGPALRPSIQPLKAREQLAAAYHFEAMKEYKKQKTIYDKLLKKWEKDNNPGALPPVEPMPPIRSRYFVSDATIEALSSILAENWRGVFFGTRGTGRVLCRIRSVQEQR